MPHDAVVSHSLPGRIRLRLTGLKGDAVALGQVAGHLRLCPSVVRVEANPVLGSLLIHHTGEWEEVARQAEVEQLFRLGTPAREGIHRRLHAGVDGLARSLSAISGQQVDLREWLTLGLIGLAIAQAAEGNIMVPAASPLWYALNAVNAVRMGEESHPGATEAGPAVFHPGGSPGHRHHFAAYKRSVSARRGKQQE